MEDSAIVSRIVHESCERAPSLMQAGRWWERLDDGFARTSEKFDLAGTDRLQIGAAAAFDHAVRAIFGTMVGTTAIPFGFNLIELRRATPVSTESSPSWLLRPRGSRLPTRVVSSRRAAH